MHRRNETANFDVEQILLDNIFVFAGYCIANFAYHQLLGGAALFQGHLWIWLIFSVIFTLSMSFFRMYNVTTFCYADRIVQRTATSGAIAGMCLTMVMFLSKEEQVSRLLFVLFCLMAFVLVLSDRFVMCWVKQHYAGAGMNRILFIGDGGTFRRYSQFIEKTSIRQSIEKHIALDDPSLRSPKDFAQLMMELSVDEVHFVYSMEKGGQLANIQSLLKVCEEMGVTASLILAPYTLTGANHFVSSVGTFPVITYHSVSFSRFQLFFKAALDVIGAAAGILVLTPIFLITAIAIKLESPGPVFFKQTRVGQNGKVFKIFKFRSMVTDAEERKVALAGQNEIADGMMFKIANDPRVTKVGAFIRAWSIDELPQLFNVLRRDMSLVGTRPPTVDEVAKYKPEHRRRISILPGITGLWQVSGRSRILKFDEVVKLDNKYIDEWSLLLDFKILLRTVGVVLMRTGAY